MSEEPPRPSPNRKEACALQGAVRGAKAGADGADEEGGRVVFGRQGEGILGCSWDTWKYRICSELFFLRNS